MDSLLICLANWRTTLIGIVAAAVMYEASVGNKLPETKQDWWAFAIGVCFILLGGAAKDAKVGSRPPVILLTLGLALSLVGCTLTTGYAGRHPGFQDIECKGKGALTGTGTLAIGAGVGGASTDSFSLTADCGEGFVIRRSQGLPSGNVSVTAPPK